MAYYSTGPGRWCSGPRKLQHCIELTGPECIEWSSPIKAGMRCDEKCQLAVRVVAAKGAEHRWKAGEHASSLELPGRIGEAMIAWNGEQAVSLAQLFDEQWRDAKATRNLSCAYSILDGRPGLCPLRYR